MTKKEQIYVKVKDTVSFGLSWTVEDSIANVVIMEGMEEYTDRYDDFARFLNKHKFNVYALDNFGQGLNVFPDLSNLGIVPKSAFRKQVQAVDALVNKLRVSARPTFIFSHSMGSLYCQDYIQRYTEHVSKVVLCGSMAKNWLTPIGYAIAKIVVNKKNRDKKAKFLNKLIFGGFNSKVENPLTPYDWISVNQKNVKDYIESPLCGYGPTNGFCLELLKGVNRLHKKKFLNKIRKDLDIFIVSGSGDPVTHYGKDVLKLEKMYKKLGIQNVTSRVYDGMRHEILLEEQKEIVYHDILEFFLKDLKKKNVV